MNLLEYPGYRMTGDAFFEAVVRNMKRQMAHLMALKRLRYSYAYGGQGPMVDQIRQECYRDIIPITDPARLLVYGTTPVRGLTSVPIYPKDCVFREINDAPRFAYPGDFEWLNPPTKTGYFEQMFRYEGARTGRKSVAKSGINLSEVNPLRYTCDLSRPVKPLKKAKRPDGKVYGCSWLQATLDRECLAFTVKRLAEEIKKSALSFNGIAFRGLSGTLVGPMLAIRLKKDLLAIRKPEGQHSSYGVEGVVRGGNYIIVDDLIDSGNTIRKIQATLDDHHTKHSALYEEFPSFNLVGIFLYAGSHKRVERFRDHVRDSAGLGHAPVFSLYCASEFEKMKERKAKRYGKQKHKA